MANKMLSAAVAIAAVVSLSACAGSVGSADEGEASPTVTFSYADLTGMDNSLGIAAQAMFEAIDEEYAGDIEVEYFWSGAMASGQEVLAAVGTGSVDFASVPTAYYPKDLRAAAWAEGLSNLNPALPEMHPFVTNVGINRAFRSDALVNEYLDHGVKTLVVATTDSYALVCNTPIESLEDAKGKIVRVASTQHVGEVEALGMTATSMSHGETYEALQRGTIDCTITTLSGAKDASIYEQAKHVLPGGFSPATPPVLANDAKLQSIPEELRDIVVTTGAQAYYSAYANATLDQTAALLTDGELSPESDVEIVLPEDIVQALSDHHSERELARWQMKRLARLPTGSRSSKTCAARLLSSSRTSLRLRV